LSSTSSLPPSLTFPPSSSLQNETISTIIESHALLHLLSLLSLDPSVFQGRTLTSGATSANLLGLATARDSFFLKGSADGVPAGWVIAEDGFPPSSFSGRIEVLGVKVHASVSLTGAQQTALSERESKEAEPLSS